ncbi:MAG TPA: FliA/WhiG family RNA polymerase sigma factor [Terriglobales bacterium]|nr:FliA/WhiG family RNA polymerase sigma factor [Terriglobales bacterium]
MTSAQNAYTELQDDKDSRDALLLEQLPQVRYIARRIHERLPQHVPLEDLVHAGVIGLIDALHKYDRGKNVQFKCYAAIRIRGAILDSLRDLDWSPRDLRRKARQIETASNRLAIELGRPASEQELADDLGVSLDEFQRMVSDIGGLEISSCQVESSQDGQETNLAEQIPTDPDQSPLAECLRSERKKALAQAISELPEKEQQVLALYYFEELTMKEVGAVLGVGESRVSQIRSLALVHLRSRLRSFGVSSEPAATLTLGAAAMEEQWRRF